MAPRSDTVKSRGIRVARKRVVDEFLRCAKVPALDGSDSQLQFFDEDHLLGGSEG
jgi:hypothetical protein